MTKCQGVNHGRRFDHWRKGFIEVIPLYLMKAFSHQPALYLLMEPSGFSLIRNIHLQPMAWRPGGRGTRVHVLLLIKASNSACIALYQFGSWRACLTDLGSVCVRNKDGCRRICTIPDLALVCMGWEFWGMGYWEADSEEVGLDTVAVEEESIGEE